MNEFSNEELHFRPADGLWSLGEVVLHIADTEVGWFEFVSQRLHPEYPSDSIFQQFLIFNEL